MTDYATILRRYGEDADRRAAENVWWTAPNLNLGDAIRRACLSEILRHERLVRFGHQCRLPQIVLTETAETLNLLEREIGSSTSFDELHDLVRSVCSTIHGAGDLYAYDIAQRIGLHLGLHPEKVYLHCGTKAGVRALGISVAGRKFIALEELPAGLRSLLPSEAEDVLCIYKNFFGAANSDGCDMPSLSGCSGRMKPSARC